jgi:hypothetical protein
MSYVSKPVKIPVIPISLARDFVKFIYLLSSLFGDLADFIVTAGDIDSVGPKRGTTTLCNYFEKLNEGKVAT